MPHPTEHAHAEPAASGDVTTLAALLALLRRQRRMIATSAALLAVVGAVLAFVVGKNYTATSQFMPNQSKANVSRFAGLAAQFGVDLSGAGGEESIDLYARLLQSREILQGAVTTSYRFARTPGGTDTAQGTLVELTGDPKRPSREAVASAIEELRKQTTIATDVRSGIVTITTSAPWAGLAEQVNARLLELLNEFNLTRRRSRAAAERRFIEERLRGSRGDLDAAERLLRNFLEQNRTYQSAPQLALEYARLRRDIDLKQQVVATLSQSYEQARIDEVRDTPVLTIIDHPEGTAERHRRIVLGAVLGLVMGFVVGAGIALVRGYLAAQLEARSASFAKG